MKTIGKIFFTGLATILPLAITIYILYWLGKTSEDLATGLLEWILPRPPRWPGVGIATCVALILLVGILMRAYVVQTIFGWGEALLKRIPLVKTLYGSVRDLMGFFSDSEEGKKSQVVMVDVGDSEIRLIGLLTRSDFKDLPEGVGTEDTVAVYLPMSYQLGGFTTMVPRSAVKPVDMSMEDAMRFAVTAGMSGVQKKRKSGKKG